MIGLPADFPFSPRPPPPSLIHTHSSTHKDTPLHPSTLFPLDLTQCRHPSFPLSPNNFLLAVHLPFYFHFLLFFLVCTLFTLLFRPSLMFLCYFVTSHSTWSRHKNWHSGENVSYHLFDKTTGPHILHVAVSWELLGWNFLRWELIYLSLIPAATHTHFKIIPTPIFCSRINFPIF